MQSGSKLEIGTKVRNIVIETDEDEIEIKSINTEEKAPSMLNDGEKPVSKRTISVRDFSIESE